MLLLSAALGTIGTGTEDVAISFEHCTQCLVLDSFRNQPGEDDDYIPKKRRIILSMSTNRAPSALTTSKTDMDLYLDICKQRVNHMDILVAAS